MVLYLGNFGILISVAFLDPGTLATVPASDKFATELPATELPPSWGGNEGSALDSDSDSDSDSLIVSRMDWARSSAPLASGFCSFTGAAAGEPLAPVGAGGVGRLLPMHRHKRSRLFATSSSSLTVA